MHRVFTFTVILITWSVITCMPPPIPVENKDTAGIDQVAGWATEGGVTPPPYFDPSTTTPAIDPNTVTPGTPPPDARQSDPGYTVNQTSEVTVDIVSKDANTGQGISQASSNVSVYATDQFSQLLQENQGIQGGQGSQGTSDIRVDKERTVQPHNDVSESMQMAGQAQGQMIGQAQGQGGVTVNVPSPPMGEPSAVEVPLPPAAVINTIPSSNTADNPPSLTPMSSGAADVTATTRDVHPTPTQPDNTDMSKAPREETGGIDVPPPPPQVAPQSQGVDSIASFTNPPQASGDNVVYTDITGTGTSKRVEVQLGTLASDSSEAGVPIAYGLSNKVNGGSSPSAGDISPDTPKSDFSGQVDLNTITHDKTKTLTDQLFSSGSGGGFNIPTDVFMENPLQGKGKGGGVMVGGVGDAHAYTVQEREGASHSGTLTDTTAVSESGMDLSTTSPSQAAQTKGRVYSGTGTTDSKVASAMVGGVVAMASKVSSDAVVGQREHDAATIADHTGTVNTGTGVDQLGTGVDQTGTGVDWTAVGVDQTGAGVDQTGLVDSVAGIDQTGASEHQTVANVDQTIPDVGQARPGVDQARLSVDQAEAGSDQTVAGVDQTGVVVDETGAGVDQTEFLDSGADVNVTGVDQIMPGVPQTTVVDFKTGVDQTGFVDAGAGIDQTGFVDAGAGVDQTETSIDQTTSGAYQTGAGVDHTGVGVDQTGVVDTGAGVDQTGAGVDHTGVFVDQTGFVDTGAGIDQTGAGVDNTGVGVDQTGFVDTGAGMDQTGAGVDHTGVGVDQTGFVDAGAGMDQSGAGMDHTGVGVDQTGVVDTGVGVDQTGASADHTGVGVDQTGFVDTGAGMDQTGAGVDHIGVGVDHTGFIDTGVGVDQTGASVDHTGVGVDQTGVVDTGAGVDQTGGVGHTGVGVDHTGVVDTGAGVDQTGAGVDQTEAGVDQTGVADVGGVVVGQIGSDIDPTTAGVDHSGAGADRPVVVAGQTGYVDSGVGVVQTGADIDQTGAGAGQTGNVVARTDQTGTSIDQTGAGVYQVKAGADQTGLVASKVGVDQTGATIDQIGGDTGKTRPGVVKTGLDQTEIIDSRTGVDQTGESVDQGGAGVDQTGFVDSGASVDRTGAGVDQIGTAVAITREGEYQPEPGVDQTRSSVDQPGPGVDQTGARVDQPGFVDLGANVDKKGFVDQTLASVDQTRPGVDMTGTGVDQPGVGVDQTGAGVDKTETGVDQSVLGVDQREAGVDQTRTGVDQTRTGVDQTRTNVDQPGLGVDQTRASVGQTGSVDTEIPDQKMTVISPDSGATRGPEPRVLGSTRADSGRTSGNEQKLADNTITDVRKIQMPKEINIEIDPSVHQSAPPPITPHKDTPRKQVDQPEPVAESRQVSRKVEEDTERVGPALESLCVNSVFIDGIGYNTYPGFCHKVVQCFQYQGRHVAVLRDCPAGYFWHQEQGLCRQPAEVPCYDDPCLNFGVYTYNRTGGCGSFYSCEYGISVPTCCKKGFRYDGTNCVPDATCTDPCVTPTELANRLRYAACKFLPDKQNRYGYITMEHNGLRIRACPGGTGFSAMECGCTLDKARSGRRRMKSCSPQFFMNFNRGFQELSGSNMASQSDNILINSGAAEFDGTGRITIWGYMDRELGNKFAIRLRFKVNGNKNGYQSIVSNCGMTGAPTVEIALQNGKLKFLAKSKEFADATVVTKAIDPYRWNEVIYMYDGMMFRAGVNGDIDQVALGGYLEKKSNPFLIGGCPRPRTGFYGLIDSIAIYTNCVPRDLFANGR